MLFVLQTRHVILVFLYWYDLVGVPVGLAMAQARDESWQGPAPEMPANTSSFQLETGALIHQRVPIMAGALIMF